MDNAVALVQAYLRVNGFFTVAEYPVLEARAGDHRMVTDIDILAFRFPHAGHVQRAARRPMVSELYQFDPELANAIGGADMLVGEVKEGAAELNAGARNAGVLEAALVRFGCCAPEDSAGLVREIQHVGRAETAAGHAIRLMAFGKLPPGDVGPATVIAVDHVVGFLRDYLRQHWSVLRHAQIKDPVLGFLLTLEKATRNT